MSFFDELKRRNVVRVGIAYAVTGWLVLQLADIIADNFTVPDWMMSTVVLLLLCGFPIALVFAWAFELTPEGVKREKDVDRTASISRKTGHKLDRAIIVILVLALGYFVFDKFNPVEPTDEESSVSLTTAIDAARGVAEAARDDAVIRTADIPEKSIAVLPFVNMSSDADQEYFSDGISEELLNVLAKFPGVHVAARTSSFQFKGQNRDIGEIAKLLKVRHVLEGSVRKAGNQVRITAQLIEADTGYHLWSENYDREMDDIFAVQDEIAAAIGDAMRVELALEGNQSVPRVAESSNTAAYEAFLQGRHLVNQRGRRNIFAARDHLERSVRLDPNYAPAHAWLAITHALLLAGPSTYGDYTREEMLGLALPHAERAVELDPQLAAAHGALGLVNMSGSNLDKAMEQLRLALELNPVFVDAVTWYMLSAQAIGNWEEAMMGARRAVEIDPLSVVGRMNYSGILANEDLEAAREMAMSIVEQNAWAGYTSRGMVEMGQTGDITATVYWLLRAYGEDPLDEFSNQGLMYSLSMVDLFDEAARISDRGHHYLERAQGNAETAVHISRANLEEDPENDVLILELADMLYFERRLDESASYFARLMKDIPDGQILLSPIDLSTASMLRYAWVLQQQGQEDAAQDLVSRHKKSYAGKREAAYINSYDHYTEGMARLIEGDDNGALESLDLAVDEGFRDVLALKEPVFDAVRTHPGFLALNARLGQMLDVERGRVLKLICHENPVPDTWQPLRETCLGVTAGP